MNYSKDELKEFMIKEIDIIQDIIKRMANNSFKIKTYTIVIISLIFILNGLKYKILISYIPLFIFWFLDAYYLWQERLYRRLYNWVINNRLKTDEHLFDMNAYRFKKEEQTKVRIMFSITLFWFYGTLFLLTLVYTLFIFLIK